MKIKPEHLDLLKTGLAFHDTDFHRERYKAAGLSDMRYRWDLLHCCTRTKRNASDVETILPGDIFATLYAYMNDDHIDTALRKIVKPL